jgi:ankyrin repeat protein
MCAASTGQIEVIQLLLEKGAKIQAKDKDGKTALKLAQSAGMSDVAKLLQEHGAR